MTMLSRIHRPDHCLVEEVPGRAAFGHDAAEYAVELGRRAGAHQDVLFHHQPARTDDELDKIAQRFAGSPVPVTVGAEDHVIDL